MQAKGGIKMLIQLNEQYRIASTTNNFELQEKVIAKEGKRQGQEYWKTIGYYGQLEHVLLKLFRLLLQGSKVEGIQSIIDEIKTAAKSISGQIKVLIDDTKEIDCTKAEKADNKCLGFSKVNDDEPIEKCKNCPQNTCYKE